MSTSEQSLCTPLRTAPGREATFRKRTLNAALDPKRPVDFPESGRSTDEVSAIVTLEPRQRLRGDATNSAAVPISPRLFWLEQNDLTCFLPHILYPV